MTIASVASCKIDYDSLAVKEKVGMSTLFNEIAEEGKAEGVTPHSSTGRITSWHLPRIMSDALVIIVRQQAHPLKEFGHLHMKNLGQGQ